MNFNVFVDPLGRLTVTAVSDNCFLTCRPSVIAEQNIFQTNRIFTTGETEDQAEWIIDDTCLCLSLLLSFQI